MLAAIGALVLGVARQVGGMTLLLAQIVRAGIPPRFDRDETWRILHRVGVESVAIVAATALFTGALMVIQSGEFIRRTGATGLLGWGAGFAVLAEIGPVLIGLMFSGRVGANNAAELGTMTVTEQIDALRILAIDPIRYLVVPRFVAMVIMLALLACIGDLFALAGGAITTQWVLGVDWRVFYHGVLEAGLLGEFLMGIVKATLFGASIAIVSCWYGLTVTGGAPGVGRAVNASVVANAVGIFVWDFAVTWLGRSLIG